jgi:hypothetical protein
MKKLSFLSVAIVLALIAVVAVGAYTCGRAQERDLYADQATVFSAVQQPESYGSADTRLWGRYRVQYYLKKKRAPWAVGNYYAYAFPVTIDWPQTPTQADIAAQVPVPEGLGNYEVCLHCPMGVEVLRLPIAPEPTKELPEKPTKQ